MIDPQHPDYAWTPASAGRPAFDYEPFGLTGTPLVSIVIPYFNTGAIFHETMRSVLRQSFQQWEVLIVNDGSTDQAALDVLSAYRTGDPRIRVLDLPSNRGLPGARNAGIREARGAFIGLLDSDDMWEPTAIEKLLWCLLTRPGHGFVNSWTVAFGDQEYLWTAGFEGRSKFLRENQVAGRALVRREVFERVGGYDEAIRGGMEDWDFWLRCADVGLWGSTIPEYLEWYRRSGDPQVRWPDLDRGRRQAAFRRRFRDKYPRLFRLGGFPGRARANLGMGPWSRIEHSPPLTNRLRSSRPRLLFVVDWMTMGGVGRFALDVIEQLADRGWESTAVATLHGGNQWAHEFARLTPDVFVLSNFVRLADGPRFLRYLVESRRPDVVMLSHSELAYRLLPYLRCWCPDPLYVDFGHIEEETWRDGGYPRLAVEYQDQLDLNLVSSEHLRDWMTRHGGDPARIGVCTTNVDTDRFAPDPAGRAQVRRELGIASDVPVLLFTGRLCAQKQPQVLGRVLADLASRGDAFVALIAGEGEERWMLEQALRDGHLLDRVRFLGGVLPRDMPRYYAASDVFLLPSRWEGIALSLYEAMAAGLAVVGADVGGQLELVAPGAGVLIDPAPASGQVAAYASAIHRLLRDPDERERLGREARRRVQERFTLAQMTDRLLELFAQTRELKARCPRQPVTEARASGCAMQVVEYLRLVELLERRGEIGLSEGLESPTSAELRARFKEALRRAGSPAYRAAVRGGLTWLRPIKEKIFPSGDATAEF